MDHLVVNFYAGDTIEYFSWQFCDGFTGGDGPGTTNNSSYFPSPQYPPLLLKTPSNTHRPVLHRSHYIRFRCRKPPTLSHFLLITAILILLFYHTCIIIIFGPNLLLLQQILIIFLILLVFIIILSVMLTYTAIFILIRILIVLFLVLFFVFFVLFVLSPLLISSSSPNYSHIFTIWLFSPPNIFPFYWFYPSL